ncbi:hypothetical protein GWI33_009006 [Rhynchophorus ferrugineus]|uniref:Uncharacterized protein n=1 Tax=Rhynchophorus ferrugineus TaxID=354439 RepID=A0A834ICK5_RHYFE|nr:hypothetical protein GWI33_009006 [Rhynchophorus ferrugineus]
MGHNFGMEHDTTECKCPDERCIMAPSSSTVAPTHWSSCSLNYLLLAFTHGMDYCLKNKPESLFDSPVCGNGFVEPGEQCDCGLLEHCDNPCCNASTCMLYSNASCATGECCDLTTCKPKNAGTLCRSADYECDLPEYCTGQSEYCPQNIYKMDTESCDGGRAFCYQGFCRTRTDQCQLLWGETGTSSDDQCYDMNTKGTRHGNCGFNKFNKSYVKCDSESVLCGMLHCKHLNERLEFGMESVAILSHSFINKKGSIIPCRTAIVDLGTNQIDPGLTPDGAKCGEGKMCVNQRCRDVMSLRKQSPVCENNCHGNGWCNNKGHCHCKDGFAPPFCENPGPGGSEDSGPASDPNANQKVVIALYIIFLGIIPAIGILAMFYFYTKHNKKFNWKKSPPTTYVIKCFQHVFCMPKGVGSLNSVPTVSNVSPSGRNIEIGKTILISTTNPDGIVRSNTITEHQRYNNQHANLHSNNTLGGVYNNTTIDGHYKKPAPPVPDPVVKSPRRLSISNLRNNIFNKNIQASTSKPVCDSKLSNYKGQNTAHVEKPLSAKEIIRQMNALKK